MKLSQIQVQVQTAGTISGFNYAFAKTLTERLKKLVETKELVEEYERKDWPSTTGGEEHTQYLSGEAGTVIAYLTEQVKYNRQDSIGNWGDPNPTASLGDIRALIRTADSFLANFEEKPV